LASRLAKHGCPTIYRCLALTQLLCRWWHQSGKFWIHPRNLKQDYEIQGNVKPGANLQTTVNAPMESFGKLTKKDVIVVWGGTHDVGRNESGNGLRQIRNFAEKLKQTNFIVMSVPHRHDLAPNSCVNQEVKVYNRKLRKHLKVHENTCVLEVDTERDLFTRHGLHMNRKGKEHIAYNITKMIKAMLNNVKSTPIKSKYKDDIVRTNNETKEVTNTTEPKMDKENLKNDRKSNAETETIPTDTLSTEIADNRLPSRQRKPPKSWSNDFLW